MATGTCIVVMGVSGCGKSTLGQNLAQALHGRFVEGDSLHPPRNVALMAAGTPLTDADRAGWLASIAALLADAAQRGDTLVVSCSALKRAYRDQLRAACPGLRLVHPHGDAALLASRLAGRAGHYMPPSLLASQLATLQMPGADEQVVPIDIGQAADAQCRAALAGLADPGRPGATTPDLPTAPVGSP